MIDSTPNPRTATIPDCDDLQEIVALLAPQLRQLRDARRTFRQQPPTPERAYAYEKQLADILRETGLVILDHDYNHLEPERREDCPLRLRLAGEEYRRRPKSRNHIGTLFGEIELQRYLYEAVEPGEPAIFPLELHLGITAGLATPALAERVALWAAEHEQDQVRALLKAEHGVSWSVQSVRQVTAAVRDGVAAFRHDAQVARLLALLRKAFASKGKHRPTLAAGRDGVNVPIRNDGYHEGAAATVSVHNRRGKRVGTVYLGQMPEAGQGTLSAQLTALLTAVLTQWHAQGQPPPRLVYITDGGNHPREYHQQVLRHMADPWHPGRKLSWQWVLDFWHACGYLQDVAEALFGAGDRAAAWFAKWRRWLRDRAQGLTQVLRSVMWHYNHVRRMGQARQDAFWKAYRYLRKHGVWMHYASYRRAGLPIGSGVTEAACKTVFSERLKRSGMTWCHAGGQVILDLRVLVLSQVWDEVHRAYLGSRPQPTVVKAASQRVRGGQPCINAA
jgi:hypothetical protein